MVALKFKRRQLFLLIVILCAIKVECGTLEVNSYSRVSTNGDSISSQSRAGNEKPIKSLLKSNSSQVNSSSVKKAKPIEASVEEEKLGVPEGRAIKSNYFLPMPNFMTKPVESSNFKSEKGNRFIVYPSYQNPNNIDQTRNRYVPFNSRLATGQLAQRRFSPSEAYAGTLYKVKHAADDYQYPKPAAMPPPPPPAAPMQQPVVSMTPPPQPQVNYLPPSKFYHPIVVDDPSPKASTATSKYFLPTIIDRTETTTPKNSINSLSDFDKDVNTSYVPPVLHAIRDAMESNYINNELDNASNEREELQRFPPNTDSIYLPQDVRGTHELVNSYVPAPSGFSKSKFQKSVELVKNPSGDPKARNINPQINPGLSQENLHRFPPNTDSVYSPSNVKAPVEFINSYFSNPSGDPKAQQNNQAIIQKNVATSQTDLNRFPPNIDSVYLQQNNKPPIEYVNSYFSNPSGDPKNLNINSQLDKLNLGTAQNINPQKNRAISQNDLNRFPPNIDSVYSQQNVKSPVEYVNSYFSNPSGDPKAHKIITKENSEETTNLVVDLSVTELPDTEYLPPDNFVTPNSYLPPNDLHVFPPNIHSHYLPPEMMKDASLINSYLPPPSGVLDEQTQNIQTQPNQASNDIHSGDLYYYAKPSGGSDMKAMMMDSMPMAMPDAPPSSPTGPSGPPDDHDHHHHHHHDHHPWDYSDLIYDDHHHHHHVEETTTTTAAPEEPRVKKYSYYYLGRKLWYIPLYFTFWFCLYVAALIIRSIGRHKVDLPNHYSRSLHDLSHPELVAKINKMTEFTMAQIEDFKEKYL